MSEEVKINEENQFTFENPEYRKTYWHTCSHVLAQAVKRLWPEVKLAIGPSIDNGFYYDMLAPFSFTPENLAEIEAEMRKICKEKLKLERFELPRAEAIKFMEEKGEPFKVELINDLPEDAVISFYKQGEFTDLCAGPHLDTTGRIKGNGIKLTACNAAYWRGDSNREVLQRIYGIAFPKKEELDAYLAQVEEAKKRDHNKLGRELEYFTTVDCIGQGLPVLLPKGARVVQVLQRWVEDTEQKRGYLLTKTPLMAKRDLYKISGHWDHYLDGMFILGDPYDETKECFALRPQAPLRRDQFHPRGGGFGRVPGNACRAAGRRDQCDLWLYVRRRCCAAARALSARVGDLVRGRRERRAGHHDLSRGGSHGQPNHDPAGASGDRRRRPPQGRARGLHRDLSTG